MVQIFAPRANTLSRMALAALVVVPLTLVALMCALPFTSFATGQDLVVHQPVPFSHEHHVGVIGLDCRYCHAGVEHARYAGLPPTETCMTCHSQLWTGAPMLAPVRQSLAQDKPLVWQRVHRLPDYVYFDHSVHVAKGVGCSSCHGAVDRMPLMRQVAPLTMGWCLDCHRNPGQALRPAAAIFDPEWQPPPDQQAQGAALLRRYQVHTAGLTDCSVCHR